MLFLLPIPCRHICGRQFQTLELVDPRRVFFIAASLASVPVRETLQIRKLCQHRQSFVVDRSPSRLNSSRCCSVFNSRPGPSSSVLFSRSFQVRQPGDVSKSGVGKSRVAEASFRKLRQPCQTLHAQIADLGVVQNQAAQRAASHEGFQLIVVHREPLSDTFTAIHLPSPLPPIDAPDRRRLCRSSP